MIKYLPYLAGTGVAMIWGFSFTVTRGALEQLEPFHLLGLRFAVAAGAMALLRAIGIIRIKVVPSDYRILLPLTVFQPLLYFSAETTGVKLTSASYSGMMLAAIPIFATILGAIFLKELPSRLQVLFICSTVAGVAFIVYMDSMTISGANIPGTIALMGAVLAASAYAIASRRASASYGPLHTTWVMMVCGAVFFNLLFFGQGFSGKIGNGYLFPTGYLPSPELWLSVIYLGTISSIGAFFLYNYVLSKLSAARASVFTNMVTVFATSAGVIILGESVYWYHLAGTGAILIGVWGANRFVPLREK